MSLDVVTLALAKSYTDQHGGGGGASTAGDFIIKMTVESDDDGNYTVTFCDTTVEQIDAAVSAEKRVVVIASVDGAIVELPMLQGVEGMIYCFGIFVNGRMVTSLVQKIDGSTSKWQYFITQTDAVNVNYSNDALPNISTVGGALNVLVPKSHTHSNKSVLDKFAETDGKPTYDGQALGGGTSDFIIKMTVEADGDNYIVTSCDATIEQIDAAVAAEKRVVVMASFSGIIYELSMLQGMQNNDYYFGMFQAGYMITASVEKIDENTSAWHFLATKITANDVDYSNTALPNVKNVKAALDELVPKSHTHANKGTLDLLSDSNGKLQYNGSDISLAVDLASYAKKTEVPTKTSQLTNDSGFLTNHQDISGKQDVITETNKLSYSLLSDTPTIPASASDIGIIEYTAAEIDKLWDSI